MRGILPEIPCHVNYIMRDSVGIEAEPVGLELHVPYWIGFFGHGERAHVVVLDAVRRRLEGAKARALFEEWLGS